MPAESTRRDLIFAHAGEAHVAASVTLAGVVAVLIGGMSMAIGPRLPDDMGRSGTSGATRTIRVIGTPPPQSVPCDDQVWPNIDQRCLVRADASSAAAAQKPAAKEPAQDVKQDDRKLTPLTATGAAVVGKAVAPEDEAIAARQAMPQPRREAASWQARPDEPAAFAGDDVDVDDVPVPPPSHRVYRHLRLPFHGHIGPFHF
jgi:hypothetical protein